MKKTTNYQLNQWEKSDRILMDDFNADNQKIDAALAARNCRFYTAIYEGSGEAEKSWTFPGKPMLVLIVGQAVTAMVQGSAIGITQFGATTYQLQVTWDGNCVSWSNTNGSGIISANGRSEYGLFAILEVE